MANLPTIWGTTINLKRQAVFRVVLILMPLLLLTVLEAALRLGNLFPRTPLFLDAVVEGREVIRLNPDVAQRYFNPKRVIVPNLYPETFAHIKPAEVYRIFCVGGSTTAGFPFEFQVPFPAQLKILFTHQYPGRRFEVINLGLSAVNSYTVLDFIPEILEHQPDLILIYMGHNEFYGAFGSASAVSFGKNGAFIRFYLQLQRLHLLQAVRNAVIALSPAAIPDPENTTLMEQVIADKKVLYGSAKYRITLANFRENLEIILKKCRNAGVPVVTSTLVSNLKDQPPLSSASLGDADPGLKKELDALTARFDQLLLNKHYPEALLLAHELIARDSLSADHRYRAGRIQLALGDSIAALESFLAARERDIIRFRAGEEINQIITTISQANGTPLVDLRAPFAAASARGIPGRELICDHLHPNPLGYYLIARSFAQKIADSRLIPGPNPNYQPPQDPFAVTDLDWDIGLLRVYKLLHRWPFANRAVDYSRYKPFGEPAAAQEAYNYLFHHHNWVQAHYSMADIYSQRGEHDKARQEYLAILSVYTERPEPWLKIAATYEKENAWAAAETAYQSALEKSARKGMIFYQLALVQWNQNKKAAAVQSIQEAIVAADLSAGQRIMAKYHLAGYFIALQRLEWARQVVQDILQEDPSHLQALAMKQKYFAKR